MGRVVKAKAKKKEPKPFLCTHTDCNHSITARSQWYRHAQDQHPEYDWPQRHLDAINAYRCDRCGQITGCWNHGSHHKSVCRRQRGGVQQAPAPSLGHGGAGTSQAPAAWPPVPATRGLESMPDMQSSLDIPLLAVNANLVLRLYRAAFDWME